MEFHEYDDLGNLKWIKQDLSKIQCEFLWTATIEQNLSFDGNFYDWQIQDSIWIQCNVYEWQIYK
jgi:hypothetical protein